MLRDIAKMEETKIKKVALYLRVSTKEQTTLNQKLRLLELLKSLKLSQGIFFSPSFHSFKFFYIYKYFCKALICIWFRDNGLSGDLYSIRIFLNYIYA